MAINSRTEYTRLKNITKIPYIGGGYDDWNQRPFFSRQNPR